eukprot:300000-Prymnesium_polylepis.1
MTFWGGLTSVAVAGRGMWAEIRDRETRDARDRDRITVGVLSRRCAWKLASSERRARRAASPPIAETRVRVLRPS